MASDTKKMAKDVVSQAAKECEDFKGVMKAAQDELNAQKEKLAQDRQTFNREKSDFAGQVDAFEFKRRDLENDRRRVIAFMQIIDQAVRTWK